MRTPRPLHFVVGTTLLALGGCTSSREREHTNVNAVEEPKAPETKRRPGDRAVNVGPTDDKTDDRDRDGDGKTDFAPNPGPHERGKPVINVVKTPDQLEAPTQPEAKTPPPK